MAIQDDIRTDLQNEVFGVLGKTVILTAYTAPTYDEWGSVSSEIATTSEITIVPYNLIDNRREYDPSGEMKTGDLEAAVPYTVTLNVKDKITMEGDDYLISEVNPNYLPDNVATIITLNKDVV